MNHRGINSQISNAYSCLCQLLVRIKYVTENAKQSMLIDKSPSSIFLPILLDIYSQIYDALPEIDVSSLIHACDFVNKSTIDFISLLTAVLVYYDPYFTDEYYTVIFFTSLQNQKTLKKEKSFIFNLYFDSKTDQNKNINDIIAEQYSEISGNSKVILFHPENLCSFTFNTQSLSFKNCYSYSNCYYYLFSFVIEENPLHYILYIYQYFTWFRIDDNVITKVDESRVKCLIHKCNIVLIGYIDNYYKIDDFSIANPMKWPKKTIFPLPDYDNNASNDFDNDAPHIQSHDLNTFKNTKSNLIGKNEIVFDVDSTNSYSENIVKANDDGKEADATKKHAYIYIFSSSKMDFQYVKSIKFNNGKSGLLHKVEEFCQGNKCICTPKQIFYEIPGKNCKLLSQYTDESHFKVYIEKGKHQGMMKYFIRSKREIIYIKFLCDFIPSLKFSGTFHNIQYVSELHSYCQKYLMMILPDRKLTLKLYFKDSNNIEYTINKFKYPTIGDISKNSQDKVVYFSYNY